MSNSAPTAMPATATPVIARITRIGLSDYRAFPAGPPYEFNLGADGRNLLLFGENGAGKTSLFRALQDLMAIEHGPENFADLRHLFAPGEEGFVSVQLTAGATNEFRWDYGDPHPRQTGGQPYALFAERCRFLDYRVLLETNFVHRGNTPNLYGLLVNDVLKDLPIIIDGKQEKLAAVHERMLATKPYDHRRKARLIRAARACEEFSTAIANHLPEVVKEGSRLLGKMGYEGMAFDLKPGTVKYDRTRRDFAPQEIALSVTLHGLPIAQPQLFLNEARLTAMALAIYLGSARLILQSLTSSADGTIPVRLLVLDDVLIGLDLANRLPVLKVLNEEFTDWQILLLTYDRVWFDLAREHTEQTGRWTYAHLKEIATTPGRPGRPFLEPGLDALAIAEMHFPVDLVSAAIYGRIALEKRVKNVCRDNGVRIAYKPDPKDVKLDQLWRGIVERQTDRQAVGKPDFIQPGFIADVETVIMILNRLSHAGAPTFDPTEVKFALDTIKRLYRYNFT